MAEVGKEKREKKGKDLWLTAFGLHKQPNKTQILDLEEFRIFGLFGLGLSLGKS